MSKSTKSIDQLLNTNVTIRWDSGKGAWVVVEIRGSEVNHVAYIDRATLLDVTFEIKHMPSVSGCTPGGYVGFAHGRLTEYFIAPADSKLLSFSETSFIDPNSGHPLERCDALYLQGDRRAVWGSKPGAEAPATPVETVVPSVAPKVCTLKKRHPLAVQLSLVAIHARKLSNPAEAKVKTVLTDEDFEIVRTSLNEVDNRRLTAAFNAILRGIGEERQVVTSARSGYAGPFYPQGTLLFLLEDQNSHNYPTGTDAVLVYNGKTGRALYRRKDRGNGIVASDNTYNGSIKSYKHRVATDDEIDAWVSRLTPADTARLNSTLPDLMAAVVAGVNVNINAEGAIEVVVGTPPIVDQED